MRSDRIPAVAACLCALFLLTVPGVGQDKPACAVSVAALSLPPGFDGLVHWRDGEAATEELQLSTRYFSERLKLRSGVIRFYEDPVLEAQSEPPPPEPLISLRIPAGAKLVYIVLWAETGEDNKPRWRGSLLSGADWKASSMRVVNACPVQLGITAGEKRLQLLPGKSADFLARNWGKAFPVKIFLLKPELKPVFSSTWRVSAGRRELCFIANLNGAISIRSLLDLAVPPAEAAP